jgi:hypothetical protein
LKARIVFAVVFTSCLLLSSCGGGSSSSNGPQGTITNGNWSIAATSTVNGAILDIGGSLVQSGSSVSGIMHIFGSACFNPLTDDVVFTGSYTGDTLVLTSNSTYEQVVTVKVTGTGGSLNGTYSIAGGCAVGDKGSFAAVYAPPITGTWGSTSTQGSATVTIVANLTEASVADAHGRFPLSGTLTYSGSPCSNAGTIAVTSSTYSSVWGDTVFTFSATNDIGGSTGTLSYVGTIPTPASPATMTGSYNVTGGLCMFDSANFQFTKQ